MSFKIRFIVLAVVLVLMAAGGILYVTFDGSTYTECLDWMTDDQITEKSLSVKVVDKDVVRVDKVYINGDHKICADFISEKPGTTTATFFKDEILITRVSIYVNDFGTVFQTGDLNFDGYFLIEVLILSGFFLIFCVATFSFFECFIKSLFSYSMVAYGGMALFFAFLIAISIYDMQWMNTFRRFLERLISTGFYFVTLTVPFMVIFCICFAISNIWLLRHEGFRLQNMLGIFLAVWWVMIPFGVNLIFYIFERIFDFSIAIIITYAFGIIVSFLECMLLSTIVSAFLSTRGKPPYDRDYLIILGCCIRSDGTLTPILKGRADAAIKFERDQFAATGKHAKFVPSGGQGPDEVISESEAMARYLKEQGYPEEQILKEDKSVNTFQNIQFSRGVIERDCSDADNARVGIATTNYHIFRSYILSKKHNLQSRGISAKTKWYFFPNAFLREFVGLLVDKRIKIAIILVLIIVAFVISEALLMIG